MRPIVIILAGGEGKNFQPISSNKTLIPFLGKPLLQHVIESVEKAGFHEAVIVTNSENEQWLASYQPFNITLYTCIQPESSGMADALLMAEKYIQKRPTLVLNAVDVFNPELLKKAVKKMYDSYAFVTGLKIKEYFPGGYIIEKDGLAKQIIEKPEKGTEPSDMINLVLHYFSEPEHFLSILRSTDSSSDDRYEKAISQLMSSQEVQILKYDGYWQKLKYSYHILDMMNTFLNNNLQKDIARSARIAKEAVIEGDVFIDEGAIVDAYAVIKGPAYIGKYVHIGNHSLVRQSIIEHDTVVGFASEVARSYIGPNCMLHHNFIGDSILESHVNPSWGTTTGNLRLDEQPIKLKLPDQVIETNRKKLGAIIAKGAFLGINCSIMPGVTIGENARVKPGTVIYEAVR